ncbi:unnamed protein product, partial [Sphacelaria rigidula]
RYILKSATKIQCVARGRAGRLCCRRRKDEAQQMAVARIEAGAAIVIQAWGRRYCSRASAIRLAQARITKYIDPSTRLPYWQHPSTGIISWSKPKIFGLGDVESAILVATKKTEFLVKCSMCDEGTATRTCKSCRDSYCESCFQALHSKGNRQEHVAPTIPVCYVCKYQHGSRLCETCTTKNSTTCAYCDVCFFNRHAGLDPLLKDEVRSLGEVAGGGGAGGNIAFAAAGSRLEGWNHRWTPLVLTCVECRRHAARWLCDDCEEAYCTGCYASVHRHGSRMMHGAEKLPYYTPEFHMDYAMACRQRDRAHRHEEAHARRLFERERAERKAAIAIQTAWRGKIGRTEGRAHLK